jgi:hypothetical protein
VARDLVFAALLMAVACVASWPLYRDGWMFVAAAAGLIGAVIVALVASVVRWPWFVQAPVAVAWGILIGVPAALPTVDGAVMAGVIPTYHGMGRLLEGSLTSWVDVISVDPPLGRFGDVLVPVFLLSYLGGWAAALGAVRGARWPGLLGACALLVYGIVFGPHTGFHPLVVGAAMLVVCVVWTQVVRRVERGVDREHTRSLRWAGISRGGVALVFVLVCSVAAAGLTTLIPERSRTVARQAYEAHYAPDLLTSPLQGYRSWVTGAAKDAPVATVKGQKPDTMIRVAVLDDYDGVAFRVAPDRKDGFTRLPASVHRAAGPREKVRITLKKSIGQWLPLAGELESVDVASRVRERLYYDRTRDAAVIKGGLASGTSYAVTSVPDAPAATAGLEKLSPGNVHQPELPVLPDALVAAADHASADKTSSGQKLQAVLEMLQAGYVSHSEGKEIFSRSGHSAGRLDALVQEEPMVGDAEQYAAAFAVLARHEGFASRVVFGLVDSDGDGTLTGSEMTAWVEVDDAKRGWVAVDPNPVPRPVHKQRKSEEDSVSLPRTVLPPDPPRTKDSTPPTADNSRPQADQDHDAWWNGLAVAWWWTWRILLVLLVVTCPWWLALVAKLVRRLRRRRHDVRTGSVVGAWNEVADAVADAGPRPPRTATRSEIAAAVAPDDTPDGRGEGLTSQLSTLAARADRASFSAEEPDEAHVREVWTQATQAVAGVRRAPARRRERWRRLLSWKSLLRRRR